jgi:hypothetical protein
MANHAEFYPVREIRSSVAFEGILGQHYLSVAIQFEAIVSDISYIYIYIYIYISNVTVRQIWWERCSDDYWEFAMKPQEIPLAGLVRAC